MAILAISGSENRPIRCIIRAMCDLYADLEGRWRAAIKRYARRREDESYRSSQELLDQVDRISIRMMEHERGCPDCRARRQSESTAKPDLGFPAARQRSAQLKPGAGERPNR